MGSRRVSTSRLRLLRLRRTLALTLFLFFVGVSRAHAQDDGSVRVHEPPADRITLTVHGKVKGIADEVEIEFVVEASNEEAGEAERLHRSKLKKVMKALEDLKRSFSGEKAADKKDDADGDDAPKRKTKRKAEGDSDATTDDSENDGLKIPTIVREGRTIFGLARDASQPGTEKGTQTTVATAVQVVMTGLADVPRPALRKRLAKIVDKAIDAGADSGGVDSGQQVGHGVRPAFRFKVKDNEALLEAAYKVAVATGRGRAERLAGFAGREIDVLSTVRETGWQLRAGSADEGAGFDVIVGRLGNNRPNNHDLLVSTTECELEVQLALEFQLKPVAPADPVAAPPVTPAPPAPAATPAPAAKDPTPASK